MITYEWEVRGFGMLRRKSIVGQLDEWHVVKPEELTDEWKQQIAGCAYRSYAESE